MPTVHVKHTKWFSLSRSVIAALHFSLCPVLHLNFKNRHIQTFWHDLYLGCWSLIKTRYLPASMWPDSDSRSAASELELMWAKNRVRDGAAPQDTQPRARGKKFTPVYPDTTAGSFVWRQESSWHTWWSHATTVKTDTISVVVAERNYACVFFVSVTNWMLNENRRAPHQGLLVGTWQQASAERCPGLPTTSHPWPSSLGPGWTYTHAQNTNT